MNELTSPARPELARVEAYLAQVAILSITDVEITDAESEALTRELMQTIASLNSKLDSERKSEKEPYLRGGKAIDSDYGAVRDRLDNVSGTLRARLSAYLLGLEAVRVEHLRLAANATAALDHAGANAAIVAVEAAQPTGLVKGVTDRYTYSIEGYSDLAAIPLAFMAPDVVKINMVIRDAMRAGIAPVIPGVVFRREIKQTVRGR